ncbi:MAG TPA: tetratricopeptide repeat protein, partial [Candidatus Hydrogenedentes bacterium]|nr:tetratricopeptide repeat protein [Candidatus Hydrogenedentota bacterium]
AAPALSVAMIVRNEAALLPEFLESVKPWADEVCVVDTGSDDSTPELAADAGCKVAHFAWCDDFAAARNESLALCGGDWVLVLDADERIAPEDGLRLRELVAGPRDACYRFTTRNYTNTAHLSGFVPCAPGDPWARGFLGWSPSTKVRLFPHGVGARFEGCIHELVNESLARAGIRITHADMLIHHYPLLCPPERIRAKEALYLRLGRDKVAACPDDPQAHVELGRQLVDMGDHGAAAAAYRDALRLAPENAEILRELGATLFLIGRHDEARRALELALRRDAGMADAWRNLGVIHAYAGAWIEALPCFEEAARLDPANPVLFEYLGEALHQSGRADEAARARERARALRGGRDEA